MMKGCIMKICPQCQTEYDDTRNFCRHDGTLLKTQQANENTSQIGDLTCPQCGKLMQVSEPFCGYCGAKFEGALQSPVDQENLFSRSVRQIRTVVTEYYQQLSPEKREFRKGIVLGFGSALLITLSIAGYQKFQENPQAPASQQMPTAAEQTAPGPSPQGQVAASSFTRTLPGSDVPNLPAATPPVVSGSLGQSPGGPGMFPPPTQPSAGETSGAWPPSSVPPQMSTGSGQSLPPSFPPGGAGPYSPPGHPYAGDTSPERQLSDAPGTSPLQEQYYARATIPEPQEVEVPVGTYRVTTSTPLRSEPYDDASVVTQLKPGVRVQVVGSVGEYMEVHSKKGRAPGYVLKNHVVLVQREQ